MKQPTAWSYSRLLDFEKCPYKYKLMAIDGHKMEENEFILRGKEFHKAHEDYVTGKIDTVHEGLTLFAGEMKSLRERHKQGQVEVEEEWAFTRKWERCDWRDYGRVWLRLKLDAMVHLSPEVGLVIDLKTGRKYGNEIKHAEQGQLYSGAAFVRYPKKQKILVEFWYADAKNPDDRITQVEYKPQFAAKALVSFEGRANKMLAATAFPPRPNVFNCPYCPFGKRNGNGLCKVSA